MQVAVLGVLVLLAGAACGCPYYQTVGEDRVDFGTFAAAYDVARVNALPIHVCDAASIEADEFVPVISDPITVVGDVSDHRAHWTVEASNLTTVLVVTANNVVFRDLQFVFENTMMEVQDNGYVFLDHVHFLFGQVGVRVATNEGVGDFLGMEGDHAIFLSVGIAVLVERGDVICHDCDILYPRDGGYVTRAGSAFERIATTYNTIVDAAVPFGVQSQEGRPIIAATLTDEYINDAAIINCRTYPDSCTTFGSGGGTSTNDGFTTRDIVFIAIFVVAFLSIFIALLAVVVQKKRRDEYVNIQ